MAVKLGEESFYPDHYDVSLLEPIPRSLSRAQFEQAAAFSGWDYWNAYELSWLMPNGVPKVAVAEFAFSSSTENIVESKSFKYYLNSLNQTSFSSEEELQRILVRDLSEVVVGPVNVRLFTPSSQQPELDDVPGRCIDNIDCKIEQYQPDAKLLSIDSGVNVQKEQLFSHLLKSNCPVTGQPDWATVWIEYSGMKISEESLLRYIVSFRQYQGYHESCVERIYTDIMRECNAKELTVYARYTRRGGLDINPIRSSTDFGNKPFGRTVRQ